VNECTSVCCCEASVRPGEKGIFTLCPALFAASSSVGSDHRLIDHLTLVRDRQTVLRSQLPELFMGEAHDYRMRIIIKRPRAVSTEILL
jgi:hypothetical protein